MQGPIDLPARRIAAYMMLQPSTMDHRDQTECTVTRPLARHQLRKIIHHVVEEAAGVDLEQSFGLRIIIGIQPKLRPHISSLLRQMERTEMYVHGPPQAHDRILLLGAHGQSLLMNMADHIDVGLIDEILLSGEIMIDDAGGHLGILADMLAAQIAQAPFAHRTDGRLDDALRGDIPLSASAEFP